MGKFIIKKNFISPILAERFAYNLGKKLGKMIVIKYAPLTNEGEYIFEIME